MALNGYDLLEKIYEGKNALLYKAKRKTDDKSVIIKKLKENCNNYKSIFKIRHEYDVIRHLRLDGIVNAYAIEFEDNKPILILEDANGVPLNKIINKNGIEIRKFLSIAISLAEDLYEIHRNSIIHKSIIPKNIILNLDTLKAKITNFALSTTASVKTNYQNENELVENSFQYISPEQTGRINKVVDFRSDLYSLGITFYEMLVGSTPFQAQDISQMIYFHLAKTPVVPIEVKKEIPVVISNIVMKLISKDAEDRYKSAYGLMIDLERCLQQYDIKKSIDEFELGEYDLFDKFYISQKLYGKDKAVEALSSMYNKVINGNKESLLFIGDSGVGKSMLINEVYRTLFNENSYFISGKFEEGKKEVPYWGIAQAFDKIMQILLMKDKRLIDDFKKYILNEYRNDINTLLKVVPSIKNLLGEKFPLENDESHIINNNLEKIIKGIIKYFSKVNSSIILFLDDVQYADNDSINLLNNFLSDESLDHFALILTARKNENLVENINTVIELKSFELDDLNNLIEDTFKAKDEDIKELANVVYEKTLGNPFFASVFIVQTYNKGFIRFDDINRKWRFDINGIKREEITDNVVNIMLNTIQTLPYSSQNTISLASCIGNKFNLKMLAMLEEESKNDVAIKLWEAVKANLIVPLDDNYKFFDINNREAVVGINLDEIDVWYKFNHDKIQQAAYSLIQDDVKNKVHVKLGNLFLQFYEDNIDEKIFEIVNNLNLGIKDLKENNEKYEFAKLNLKAGIKAKEFSAYESACYYLKIANNILPNEAWDEFYEIAFEINVQMVESEYLYLSQKSTDNSDINDIDKLEVQFKDLRDYLDNLMKKAKTKLHKAKLFKIRVYCFEYEKDEIINYGIDVANTFDINLKSDNIEETIKQQYDFIKQKYEDINKSLIIENKDMEDQEKVEIINLLEAISWKLERDEPLYTLVVLKMFEICIEHGNCQKAPIVYCLYGNILGLRHEEFEEGYEFGELGVKLSERYDDKLVKAATINIFGAYIAHWHKKIQDYVEIFMDGVNYAGELGNHLTMAIGIRNYFSVALFGGENLGVLYEFSKKYSMLEGYVPLEFVKNLKDLNNKYMLSEQLGYDINKLKENKINSEVINCLMGDIKTLFFFKEYDKVYEKVKELEGYTNIFKGCIEEVEFYFYYGITCLNIKNSNIEKAKELSDKLKIWSERCKENFLHFYELLNAEISRVEGDNEKAIISYDIAIKNSKVFGFKYVEALANEFCGSFYIEKGQEFIGKSYIKEAVRNYQDWGAIKVLDLISQKYSLDSKAESNNYSLDSHEYFSEFDLVTLMEISDIVLNETETNKLSEKLLKTCIENVGAQKVIIMFEKNNELVLDSVAIMKDDFSISIIDDVTQESLPNSIINYSERTGKTIIMDNATQNMEFKNDEYVLNNSIKSVVCMPMLNQAKVYGIIYMENNLSTGIFNPRRVKFLKMLSSQVAMSIKNAKTYEELNMLNENLENKVNERTKTLNAIVEDLKSQDENKRNMQNRLLETNTNIKNILDNAEEGFLTFDESLKIDKEYSIQCKNIFGADLTDKNFADLIFVENDPKKDTYKGVIELILKETDSNKISVYTKLLKDEIQIGDRYINIKYKLIERMKDELKRAIMVILTDVTKRKELEIKMELEKNKLNMIVKIVSSYEDFIQATYDYQTFYNEDLKNMLLDESVKGAPANKIINEIFRNIHTFKGIFAQFEMKGIVKKLHKLETNITAYRRNEKDISIKGFKEIMDKYDMQAWLIEESSSLKKTLGTSFFEKRNTITISKEKLDELKDKIEKAQKLEECKAVIHDITMLTYKQFKELISVYPAEVERLSERLGKHINPIVIDGGEMLVEPEKYHAFTKSLVHVFRNCVDHGIENMEERIEMGKPEIATIKCRIVYIGYSLYLMISDDGRGVDVEKIKAKALKKGICSLDEMAKLSDKELIDFIFRDEFSTKDEITDLSGRGVGLSAVKQEIEKLGGEVTVKTQLGQGTEFKFMIPL